mmetsp:Transcript_82861/g.146427  ORF Transcript_82861/g.146427 Transcript_82861/m.146427 type:complete len:200 (+) Transcript_82861:393-992(+)
MPFLEMSRESPEISMPPIVPTGVFAARKSQTMRVLSKPPVTKRSFEFGRALMLMIFMLWPVILSEGPWLLPNDSDPDMPFPAEVLISWTSYTLTIFSAPPTSNFCPSVLKDSPANSDVPGISAMIFGFWRLQISQRPRQPDVSTVAMIFAPLSAGSQRKFISAAPLDCNRGGAVTASELLAASIPALRGDTFKVCMCST